MAQSARDRLNYLWRQIILPKPLLTTADTSDHVTGLEQFNITHRTQVDFENADEALLFKAMDQKNLDDHPVDPDEVREDCPFPEYNPAGHVGKYTNAVCTVVERWGSLGALRPSILSDLNVLDIQDTMNIRAISECSTFYLGKGLHGLYSHPSLDWGLGLVMESLTENNHGLYPHLVITGNQPVDGKEDCILLGELSLLLSSMRNRANQVEAPNDEEIVNSLSDTNPEELSSLYDLSFPNEENFPVLLLSFVGPHNGRLFQAYMDNGTMHILQSKLYNFRDENTSPLDFFARYLLSRPILMPGKDKPHGRYATRSAVKNA